MDANADLKPDCPDPIPAPWPVALTSIVPAEMLIVPTEDVPSVARPDPMPVPCAPVDGIEIEPPEMVIEPTDEVEERAVPAPITAP
jgi:hypothetical protein